MKNTGKTSDITKRSLSAWVLFLCIGSTALCYLVNHKAHADDDPFQLDSGHWMSSAHYQDAAKRGVLDEATAPQTSETAPVTPSSTTASVATTIAVPGRPIDLPVMPGLNKGFDVKVSSTEDENNSSIPAPIIETDKSSDIHLSDKNWASPRAAPGTKKDPQNEDDSAAPASINVRMSFLPNEAITPVSSPDHNSSLRLSHMALEKSIENKNKTTSKTPAEAATCAAIDAYKKQQLDALQSDRQTLKALQDAISSLGLQKQLGFMTGNNSSLGVSGSGSTSANMDIPSSTTIR